ncbi:MAG TPA: helix-turn-helix domain-containing protein [Solirubrobacterales bacterium]|nr:helix-turn-helix domain-containing protein [Solirubrobacterales bacterium]
MPTVPLRKDSARTLSTILVAAEELLADNAAASFAELSVASGVSPATVYRYFPDRPSLLVALMRRSLDEIKTEVDSWEIGPGTFVDLLTLLAAHQARYQGVLSAVRRGEVDGPELLELESQTLDLLREPFAVAKHSGRLRADLEVGDVIPILAMIDGALSAVTDRKERERAAARAITIILDGIR